MIRADLTEIISPVLDTIKPDPFPEQYFLEITSPGLERPLKTKEAVAGAVGETHPCRALPPSISKGFLKEPCCP